MNILKNKNILIGITGGIAAYKIPLLVRSLIKDKANVKIVMTANAERFITPLTLQTLSKNKVYRNIFTDDYDISHIDLAQWADLFITAPATANIIGKAANGIADDLLSTVFLSFNKKVIIVPSMNSVMYSNKIFQRNLEKLKKENYVVMEPGSGSLACGSDGPGRLPDIESIKYIIEKQFCIDPFFVNRKVMITAGPTREYLDPIRYFSNSSSGKQGAALAEVLDKKGADVTFISGASNLTVSRYIKTIYVESAHEMYKTVKKDFAYTDIFIANAAVADYKPVEKKTVKIKKDSIKEIKMKKNIDILKAVSPLKKKHQLVIGFSADSSDIVNHARKKLKAKKCDIIIANKIEDSFGKDENSVIIIDGKGNKTKSGRLAKKDIAFFIADAIKKLKN